MDYEKKSVEELRALDLPHATTATIGLNLKPKEGADEMQAMKEMVECVAVINEYLHQFADTNDKCPQCEAKLGGLLGNFTWGMAHGEGHCIVCGYPCRAYHRNVDVIEFLQHVLPYHPDALLTKAERKEREAQPA